jgi:hypothetical protein
MIRNSGSGNWFDHSGSQCDRELIVPCYFGRWFSTSGDGDSSTCHFQPHPIAIFKVYFSAKKLQQQNPVKILKDLFTALWRVIFNNREYLLKELSQCNDLTGAIHGACHQDRRFGMIVANAFLLHRRFSFQPSSRLLINTITFFIHQSRSFAGGRHNLESRTQWHRP